MSGVKCSGGGANVPRLASAAGRMSALMHAEVVLVTA